MPKESEVITAPSIWNLPNALTMLRIALVPVFAIFLSQGSTSGRLIAAAVFVLAALTDRWDGQIARKRGLETNFGKLADTIADKLLVVVALVLLSWIGDVAWWVTVALTARELAITVLKLVVAKRYVMPPSSGGRLKAALQMLGISVVTVPWVALLGDSVGGGFLLAGQIVLYIATLVALVTMVDYVVKAGQIMRRGAPSP